MKNNELIIHKIQELELCEMDEQDIIQMKNQIVDNVSITTLEKAVKEAILHLSRVGPPSFMADAKFIALDNQKRLDIIYLLLDNFELFKTQTSNLKRDKMNCNYNFDYVFNYLSQTQDLIKTIYSYAEFQHNEKLENQKMLQDNKIKMIEDKTEKR